MRVLDTLCAGALFLLALVLALLIPRTYPGRVWIFGTDLAILFAAMLNFLRMQNGLMRSVKVVCFTANFAVLVFLAALMVSIGLTTTLAHVQIPIIEGLFLFEIGFCVRKGK